ncbi:tRNA pseudouridine(38-40) synthase TruA [Calothrix sp. NIES-3974]|uniref:tRNA pseudouridine(38-40) synthase TruA n=1 Tax=Calothrix sp. NIES-3974 TaxID=2005462 RepID=UPI000B61D2C1|nr:tRNA pseudouridine(38-40) synthase TruA [Calothrix sp. NIES-3974]BAZ04008.1 tRNA-pseudouridine synthase I [Calothrix sp. NIES-3974]
MSDQEPSPAKQRVALVIQYLGTHFHGWQRQPQHRSVQAEIETAIATVVGKRVTLHGAGRTDSGVHAAAQVAHFDVTSKIPPHKWAKVLNSRLPKDINILASAAVAPTWHARFSASYRRYRYTLYTGERPNLFIGPYVWHYYQPPLDETLIQAALQPLVGKHHLSAFRRSNSLRPHSWVEVQAVKCDRNGDLLQIEIQANGFLYGMVRLLVGMLVQVGSGTLSLVKFTDLWKQEQREEIRYAAPPQGLCLLRVGYPDFPFPPEVWFDTQPHFHFHSEIFA